MRAYLIWKNDAKTLAFGLAIRRKELPPFFDRRRRNQKIALAVLLSLLVHLLVGWYFIEHPIVSTTTTAANQALTVSLEDTAPRPKASAVPESAPPPSPAPTPTPEPIRPALPRPKRPIIAVPGGSRLSIPAQPLPEIPLPPPPSPNAPPQEDMMSRVNAKREQRATEEANERSLEAAAQGESDDARGKRIALANLAATNGQDKDNHTGGIFEITHQGLHDATFTFHGWNKTFLRNTISQQIDVTQGNAPTIELAIIDRMIDIIRQYEQKDFQWDSSRLGRTVTLSARKEDTAGLESFLMKEFNFEPGGATRPPPAPAPPRRGRG